MLKKQPTMRRHRLTAALLLTTAILLPLQASADDPQSLFPRLSPPASIQPTPPLTSQDPAAVPALRLIMGAGAKPIFLETRDGLTVWSVTTANGPRIVYTTPSGKHFIDGTLYTDDGRNVTEALLIAAQVIGSLITAPPPIQSAPLQPVAGPKTQLSALAPPASAPAATPVSAHPQPPPAPSPASPSTVYAGLDACGQPPALAAPTRDTASLLADAEAAAAIDFGPEAGPVITVFVDARCPYSLAQFDLLDREAIQPGKAHVRLILVDVNGPASARDGLTILSDADPAAAWRRQMAVGARIAPDQPERRAAKGIAAFATNRQIWSDWSLSTVPYTVVKDRTATPRVYEGLVKDVKALLVDITPTAP
jgi:hypothetical protein